MTIAQLKTGDRVRDKHGSAGEVIGFTRDHARIKWTTDTVERHYDDNALRVCGVVRVSPFVDEDTRPE